eukprot:TRINITY_DN121601_c0_g1_i1.p1 TRINITY_DN121601_c0_g1~~TRINITY_DN121601_c0_g1_i1.p1  ORF type:complete len:419 (-),score=97.56 TRINITY_DN121601_c0_g1_i1:507-1763(-)
MTAQKEDWPALRQWVGSIPGLEPSAVSQARIALGVYFADFALLDFFVSDIGKQVLIHHAKERKVAFFDIKDGEADKENRDRQVSTDAKERAPLNMSAKPETVDDQAFSAAPSAVSAGALSTSCPAVPGVSKNTKHQRMCYADRQQERQAGFYFGSPGGKFNAAGNAAATSAPKKHSQQSPAKAAPDCPRTPDRQPMRDLQDMLGEELTTPTPEPRKNSRDDKEKAGDTITGVLKSFNEVKGYGFFKSASVEHDIFVRRCDLPALGQIVEGRRASFRLTFNDKDRPQAQFARWLEDAPPVAETSEPTQDSQRRYLGRLKSVGDDYGFIACEEFARDVYVPRTLASSDVEGVWAAKTPVWFSVAFNGRGQPQARDVEWGTPVPAEPADEGVSQPISAANSSGYYETIAAEQDEPMKPMRW